MLAAPFFMVAVLLTGSARSQEQAHQLTIADCPAGYVLGIQDTADPQPFSRIPDPAPSTYEQANQQAAALAQQQAAAPRQFVTGCVPSPSLQNQR